MNTHSKATIAALTLITGSAFAMPGGLVSTDRFGYSGSVTRYATLADAQSGSGAIDSVSIGDRDLSVYFANNDSMEADFNAMLGSWWYTTDAQGRAGWGNTRGNTGPGYLQLYDADASTDTSVAMNFSNFDGTYYTDFELSVTGENANTADDFSRVSVYDNVNDAGIWHSYSLNMVATGLEGVMTAPGIIEANNHATGVSGSISGIFELTENQTSPANQGFYVIDFDLSMINWAWDNRNDLMTQDGFGDPIADEFGASLFRTVPAPGATVLLAMGGVLASRRRRS